MFNLLIASTMEESVVKELVIKFVFKFLLFELKGFVEF